MTFRKKITLKELQQAMTYGAPDGGMKNPPSFMNEKPREGYRGPRKHPEDDLQIQCVNYLKLFPNILYWSTPNHIWVGQMTPAKMNYLKKQKAKGLIKGIPDLSLMFRNIHGVFTFVFAELKIGYAKPEEDQQKILDKANSLGAFTGVVRSLEDLQVLLHTAEFPSFS